ncbi:hypothetical protein B0H10DRAFT_2228779 [Mycena sp. CBHHK59/15]|nr:hypothetical protein B0H10DRAFT_2228779 [Mycena sp. CBHHK59/15]
MAPPAVGALPGDSFALDYLSLFDITPFPGSDQSFDALMPATAPTPTDHSTQNLAGFGFAPPAASSGYISSDFTFGTLSAGTPEYSQWPMLPPAQPDSPSASSVAIEDLSAQSTSTLNTAKKRRQHQEVDPANILKPSSVQSRIPSERKRVGEAEASERPMKKAKGSKCLVDVAIAGILTLSFSRSKNRFATMRTNRVLDRLIRMAVQSGALTAVFALGTLFTFHFATRIYTHTMMDHLISREELRNMLSVGGNHISAPGNHISAPTVSSTASTVPTDIIILGNSSMTHSSVAPKDPEAGFPQPSNIDK